MPDEDEGLLYANVTDAQIGQAFADKTRSFYIGQKGRLGWHAFASLIEYGFFHPRLGPEPNSKFEYYVISFGIPHYVFAIPRKYEKRTNQIARALKLKPVIGVVPMLIDPSGTIKRFPGAKEASIGRKNLVVIESGDPQIYNNDQQLNQQIRDRESQIVDTLMLHGPVMTPQQVCEFLWRRQ